jgi:hypothetical protein
VDGSFQRYLRAKRSVDDRSLDRRLLDRLQDWLTARASRSGPVSVLEVGAGVGTMVERLWEWDVFPATSVEYTAVDVDEANVRAIPDQLGAWASGRDVDASVGDGRVELAGQDRTVTVEAAAAEASTFVADAGRQFDLLVGMAFLDLVSLEQVPTLLSALTPGGCWYFPITFDGGTRFVPAHPADDAVERHYHRHMDAKAGGDSHAGSHALDRLLSTGGATVEAVAGSDWIVYPADGSYPGDEAYFLRYVLDTVETALGELDHSGLADDTLADWLATRRKQVETAELTYLTHQLDLLGRVDGSTATGPSR